MTRSPLTVKETTSLNEATRLLLQKRIRRLPVVDGNGRLVGQVGGTLHTDDLEYIGLVMCVPFLTKPAVALGYSCPRCGEGCDCLCFSKYLLMC